MQNNSVMSLFKSANWQTHTHRDEKVSYKQNWSLGLFPESIKVLHTDWRSIGKTVASNIETATSLAHQVSNVLRTSNEEQEGLSWIASSKFLNTDYRNQAETAKDKLKFIGKKKSKLKLVKTIKGNFPMN